VNVIARPGTWTIDTTASTAEFAVRKLFIKTVRGSFPISEGRVIVDSEGEPRSVAATLDATGFTSGNPKRDDHVRSAQFLNVARNPSLSFTSSGVTRQGPQTWRIEGVLTIRGEQSGVTLIAEAGRLSADDAEITATARVSRREAGVAAWPTFLIGEHVDITLTIRLRPEK